MTVSTLCPIANPLVSSAQLLHYRANSHAPPPSVVHALMLLTHAAGLLLRLPIDTTATAIVLLQRYLLTTPALPSDTSLSLLSATALYLSTKLSSIPTSPRSILNVYALLTRPSSSPLPFIAATPKEPTSQPDPLSTYYLTEGDLARHRLRLFDTETGILRALGFSTHVALPHALALTYLSALSLGGNRALAARVFALLNSALLSPQWLYTTHQPNELAVAAIYLAAREVGAKVPVGNVNWWEVFDVSREALGFVVVGLGTIEDFASQEAMRWKEKGGLSAELGVL
jgi:cyclin L